jgi:septum formation protein
LLTGHCIVRMHHGAVLSSQSETAHTTVQFGTPSDSDLAAYLADGEPLHVAGAFTLDGRGGWFIDRIDGDPSNVIGLSLPLTRKMLQRMDLSVQAIWSAARSTP